MKILALMPCYKVIQVEAVQSLTAMQADIYNRGDNVKIFFTSGFNPVLSRTALFHQAAKEENVDYVLCIDSDHIYKASQLYDIIEKMNVLHLDMLSAAYLMRGPGKRLAHGIILEDGRFKALKMDETNSITDCDVLGFGFLVLKWGYLKRMVDKYDKDLFHMDYQENATEDVYFCRQAKKEGTRICFDADTVVGHLTTIINQ